MNLTQQEERSIEFKKYEYKAMLHKSVYITYILMNVSTGKIKQVMNVYTNFKTYCSQMKAKLQQHERISDNDHMATEAIGVFVVQLLINALQKYQSKKPEERQDAYLSCRLNAILLNQFFNKKRQPFKQYEYSLESIAGWYVQQRKLGKMQYVSEKEIEDYIALFTKIKKGQFSEDDMIKIEDSNRDSNSTHVLPEEMKK
jgi:hypothetical protein